MLVKKYLVKNVNEGIAKIKFELGSNAIVISQRKVRQKGLRGLFLPKVIEITAAAEGSTMQDRNSMKEEIGVNEKLNFNRINIVNNKRELLPQENLLAKEVADMKNLLQTMVSHKGNDVEEEHYKNYRKFLQDKDVSEKIITSIINFLKEKSVDDNEINKELIKKILNETINYNLCENETICNGVIAFVGPTGVGKTTTIAKLAGKYTLTHKRKVGLITVDTYRIGAVEQLKTYAEIMNIPFKVVFNMKEMEETIESMSDCDTIFVDTTGRSCKNLMQLQELRAFVTKSKAEKIFLVLSSTTKPRDVASIIEGYKIMGYNSLIITKLDETSTYGSILTMIDKAQVPVTYITTGQSVPQDIKNVNNKDLLQIILGENDVC